MARTLVQIKKQIDKLQKEAEHVRAKEIAGVILRIKTAIDFYALKADDLFESKSKAMAKSKGKSTGTRKVKVKKSCISR